MSLDMVLLVGALVLLVAALAAVLGTKLGLPSLLLFLGVGMVLEVFGLRMDDADLAHALGFAALVFILGEGGFSTRWADIRAAFLPAGLLATVGVLASIGAVATFTHFVIGLPWAVSVLFGAVTAPTDSAAVFAVLRSVPLPQRVRAILEAESGLNDAPVVLLVGIATAWSLGDLPGSPLAIAGMVLLELVGGLALGLALGFAGAFVLKRTALPASGLYPLAAMAIAVLSYGLGVLVHVSGFAAVYVCAVVLGNAQLPHRSATRSFAEGIGWIAQIGLFVMLGMLSRPERLSGLAVFEGIAAGAFLTFVARPLSVVLCTVWFRITWQEMAFISWAGLRGAVPIIMATVPLAAAGPESDILFDAVFVFVVVFTVLQAPTLPWVARRLGIADTTYAIDVDVEVVPLDRIHADFLQIRVPEGSHLVGLTVTELRLPRPTVVTMIIRDAQAVLPTDYERILTGDELLIVAPSRLRQKVEDRLRDVGRRGRLAGWNRD